MTRLYDEFGFDTVDTSPPSESWRSGPGQPLWKAQLGQIAAELKNNLARAQRAWPSVETVITSVKTTKEPL